MSVTTKCDKVLKALENGHWMTAREIGKRINLPAVSVGHVCMTLINLGYIEKKQAKLRRPPSYFLNQRLVNMYRKRRF